MKKMILILTLIASASLVFGQGHLDPRNDDWPGGGGGAGGCSVTFDCTNGWVQCTAGAGGTCSQTSNGVKCTEADGTITTSSCN